MAGDGNTRVPHEKLFAFCRDCFLKVGVRPEDAEITADNLLFANLRGIDSHGVVRMRIYAERLRAGSTKAQTRIEIVQETAASALIDAHSGVGQVAGREAMKLAIRKASQSGMGWVGVRNSSHYGAAAYYAMMALEEKMIGIALTNAGPSMAPSGGREPRLGNNPVAIAVPAGRYPPLVLDMATGAVAWGKIYLAQQEKKKIPTSWALDKEGVPTDDPDAAVQGGLIQPVGGYKGYGLSLMIDVLTGVLCGSGFSTFINHMYKHPDKPTLLAHACAALPVESFMPFPEFCSRIDQVITLMRSCPIAAGVDRIYVPGEIEYETERERRTNGIPLGPNLTEDLRSLGAELGVTF